MSGNRQFLQSATDSRNAMREVLQLLFATELLSPSKCLWIVSPWLRDIPIIDNSSGSFSTLCPDFQVSEVGLVAVVGELLNRGGQIVIATRPEAGNLQLLDSLRDRQSSGKLLLVERAELHAKGIVGDRAALFGSMNFTFNGLQRLTEMLELQTKLDQIEKLRLTFRKEYGGVA
jgi:phosphatidylserine/phosphatidylglycerophosphate/cardiolipin synthase-like enzyme